MVVGGAAVSGAQQTDSQNAFVHTHMLDSLSRTANITLSPAEEVWQPRCLVIR